MVRRGLVFLIAVGRLVLSLPTSDPWERGKLADEQFLFKRVHRIVHVQSRTGGHGYEVCRLRREFPTHDYKEENRIQPRFLELINADDYQTAEREFYKHMRRELAYETISQEYETASMIAGTATFRTLLTALLSLTMSVDVVPARTTKTSETDRMPKAVSEIT